MPSQAPKEEEQPYSMEADALNETGRYDRVQALGKGSFGFVQLARSLGTKELQAIKFLKRGDINKYVEAEIVNHSLLRHPHVIQFKEVFLTSEFICISMEYATGGSLFHYVQKQGKLKEAVARWFFQQLVIGVDYCHSKGVANRDIKLENTLLQVVKGLPLPLLKICDFGYSKADFKSAAKSKVGTLTYMAPEVLVNRDGAYDGKVADIWSCGVMLYVMLFGRYPFDTPAGQNVPRAAEILRMLDKMVNQKYPLPPHVEVSPAGLDLLRRLLQPDPEDRITVDDIMTHPWFLSNLPPQAVAMNSTYVKATMPAGHQPTGDVRRILEEAKSGGVKQFSGLLSVPDGFSPGGLGQQFPPQHCGALAGGADRAGPPPPGGLLEDSAALDASVDAAMVEVAAAEAENKASAAVHQFVQMYQH